MQYYIQNNSCNINPCSKHKYWFNGKGLLLVTKGLTTLSSPMLNTLCKPTWEIFLEIRVVDICIEDRWDGSLVTQRFILLPLLDVTLIVGQGFTIRLSTTAPSGPGTRRLSKVWTESRTAKQDIRLTRSHYPYTQFENHMCFKWDKYCEKCTWTMRFVKINLIRHEPQRSTHQQQNWSIWKLLNGRKWAS